MSAALARFHGRRGGCAAGCTHANESDGRHGVPPAARRGQSKPPDYISAAAASVLSRSSVSLFVSPRLVVFFFFCLFGLGTFSRWERRVGEKSFNERDGWLRGFFRAMAIDDLIHESL